MVATSRIRITRWTVLNRLNEVGFHCFRSIRCPPLTTVHRARGLLWCNERTNWNEKWRTVMLSDESHFCLRADRHTVRV